jgi:signal transduction histidine kinase
MTARNRDNLTLNLGRSANPDRTSIVLAIFSDLARLLNKTTTPAQLIPLVLAAFDKSRLFSCTVIRLAGNTSIPAGIYKKCRKEMLSLRAEILALEAGKAKQAIAGSSIQRACGFFAENGAAYSLISIPLCFDNRPLGALTFFGGQDAAGSAVEFAKEDEQPLQGLATLVANALTGAATFLQVNQCAPERDKQLRELSLLYRHSNTMLSTIKLNKLIHLTLTALTSGALPFFDRAMLFLINERSGMMQGMLGVTSENTSDLINKYTAFEDILASQWELSEEDMKKQQDSKFNRLVMASRLELNTSLNIASRAVKEKKIIHIPDVEKNKFVDRNFVNRFGITSFAVAPLMARDQVLGVIIVDNSLHGNPILREDLRFLQLFTNQAGMAIENSILYNRVADAHQELRDAQERLIQGERLAAIGEMTAGVAHELKAPLVAIGGFAARLVKKLPAPSVEWDYAELITKEVLRLEKILSDILLFSKKTTICYARCGINGIIKDALAVAIPSLSLERIRITTKLPRKNIHLFGDCQQLQQVFINLLLNACEAMEAGGELRIDVTPAKMGGSKAVSVNISDTGGGIPPEKLHNIFTPFYTTKGTGTGLGLPIANRIITNHGGKIEIHNKPGIGVEFSVIIPLQT